jgi:hypothetical protein
MNRRLIATGATVAAALGLAGGYNWLSMGSMPDYEAEAARSRELIKKDGGLQELVRFATLAANSHNTQPWKFAAVPEGLKIVPDLTRATPAVDPDNHHLYASLGCAAENIAQAATILGKSASIRFANTGDGEIFAGLADAAAGDSELARAIPARQCTRATYASTSISPESMRLLVSAAQQDGIEATFVTDAKMKESVLELIMASNRAQIADAAFMTELKSWLRFNPAAAMATRDGLFSACSGNPVIPGWLGPRAIAMFMTADGENAKVTEQVRSSAGLVVFSSVVDDRAHWFNAGRAYERFALQATTLGLRNAHLNQAVEVKEQREQLKSLLGLGSSRPDMVVRFGEGPVMPMSLRRPVEAVMV